VGRCVTVDSNMLDKTILSKTTVIADDVYLEAGCELSSTKVYPHKRISKRSVYGGVIQ